MKPRACLGLASIAIALATGLPLFGAAGCSSSSAGPGANTVDAADASSRACGVGTIAQPDKTCVPADFAVACAPGFAPDPSGYGCRDVLPTDPCIGATRAALGQTTCVPVGDCNAAFPPSNATLFVSASGPADATHFKTISAAVAAAASGAVIAVDSGTYVEQVKIPLPLSIVGKCPASVIIDGNSGEMETGIEVDGTTVSVSGITIRGALLGVSMQLNSALTLTHSILDANLLEGLEVEAGMAKVSLDDVVIRNTSGSPGVGSNVQASSELDVTNSEITGNHDTGIRVSSSSKLVISNSVISNTTPATGKPYGRGLAVQNGADANISTTALIGNEETAIVLTGATATLSQIVVRDTHSTPAGDFGRAIDAFDDGNFTLDSSTFSGNADASIIVVNATAAISKSIIQNTQLDGTGNFGRGLTVQEAAHVTLAGSAILGSHESAIAVFSPASTLSVTKSFVEGTQFNSTGTIGYGIVGIDGAGITIANSEIDSCAGAGIGFGGAGGIVTSSVIAHNGVGIATTADLTLEEVDTAPTQVDLTVVAVTSSTTFIDNLTRVTSGDIPIPQTLGPVK